MSNIKVPYSELLQNPQQAEILTTYELKEDKMPKAWYPKSVKTMIKLQFTRVVNIDGKKIVASCCRPKLVNSIYKKISASNFGQCAFVEKSSLARICPVGHHPAELGVSATRHARILCWRQ